MRWLAAFIALCLALCAVALGAIWAFTDLFTARNVMGTHGWIAMGLGVTFTAALGVGLMGLVFYSHRSRKDDEIR